MILKSHPKFLKVLLVISLLTLTSLTVTFLGLFINNYYTNHLLPKTTVRGLDISHLDKPSAISKLAENYTPPPELNFAYSDQVYTLKSTDINLEYNTDYTINSILNSQRDISILNVFKSKNHPLYISYDKDKLSTFLATVASGITEDPVYPKLSLINGEVLVTEAKKGSTFDINSFLSEFENALQYTSNFHFLLAINEVDPTLNPEQKIKLIAAAQSLIDKKLTLQFENQVFTYTDIDLISLLDLNAGFDEEKINNVIIDLASKVEREAQNPIFVYKDNKVEEFKPAKDGISIEKDTLAALISSTQVSLSQADQTLTIPYQKTPPLYQTSQVNNLGIKELLGIGESYYKGSIPSRIYNVNLAASHFNGALIPPNTTVSFNELLGDVSQYTGYKQAYVIKDGKTVLGDGGGVCQVSTTLFRASMAAGLPIVERRPHSYRVSYYEQGFGPGLDATVYAPTTDLKIQNDTPAHILIQVFNDPQNTYLRFEIYGTSDGRIATISKPITTSVIVPPEDLYVDDPTLPIGTVKQIEHKAWGARVNFDYTVVRNGETIFQKTFVSNYKSWQAVYLKGTAPI